MPDTWEVQHQLDPLDPLDAAMDADADGQSNQAEFLAGTDPRDADSCLRLEWSRSIASGLTLRFHAVEGRTYRVEARESLGAGSWVRFREISAQAQSRSVETEAGGGGPAFRYFRVVTPGGL
jgi:hypothetical protein